jgi:hypothetical protein
MKNIFLILIPSGNYEALVHYQDTITNRVDPERIYRHIDSNLRNQLSKVFGNKPIAVWGSRDTSSNRTKYDLMQAGDDILIVEGNIIKLLGKIAVKTINSDLSKELWKNLKGDTTEGWDLIYFIANPLEIDLPFNKFNKLFNFKENFAIRGLTKISQKRLEEFYNRYDDLYSILLRIKNGLNLEEVDERIISEEKKEYIPLSEEENQESVPDEISEHLKIQWKLICLGKKAGTKIWVPKSDQTKIGKEYQFDEFEPEFTAGIDVPAKYVENIDVVWKEEFRIDAAFEIEHSTSVYSGLLRFSDLKIIAPNSNYPLFIVSPAEKRNRILEQIKRPTFKMIGFDKKVRFLPYEALEEIDNFFKTSTTGLNIDLIVGKSEAIK